MIAAVLSVRSSDGGELVGAGVGLVLPAELLAQVDGGAAAGRDAEGDLVYHRAHDQQTTAVLGVGGWKVERHRRQTTSVVGHAHVAAAVAEGGGHFVTVGGTAVPDRVGTRLGDGEQHVGDARLAHVE